MISFQSISLQRGLKTIFEEASCCFYPGQKIGVIGKNGAGKTTLFSLITQGIELDKGTIELSDKFDIAYVEQEVQAGDLTSLEYVKSGDYELYSLEQSIAKLSSSTQESELTELSHAYEKYEALGGYQLDARVQQLLNGLGFSSEQIESPVKSLSGGWQIRLNLAKALIKRSDILLLDEPTNHLDIEAVMWLEKWLKHYPGMVLLISHDRMFLDHTVEVIAHIDQYKIQTYSGNYSQFERQRAEALELQQKAFEKQQKNIAHLQSFVDRFKAKASKAKQAQSRVKMLEKIQRVEAVRTDSGFNFNFSDVEEVGGPLITLNHADCGYQVNKPILNGIGTSILSGMRIGLLGVNGAGKSTFIKTLVGQLKLLKGEYLPHSKLKIGYFEQHSIEQLHLDWTPLEHMQDLAKEAKESELRSFLGRFNFSNDMALTQTHHFSGGEKARLALAMIVYQQPNLLLLDEPTNHLDIDMRQALVIAMQSYNGAVIMVSHDRYLLEATVDEFWLIAQGQLSHFKGDLDDYQKLITAPKESSSRQTESINPDENMLSGKEARQHKAKQRAELQPLRKKIQTLEKEMDKLQKALAEIETKMQSPELFEESNKAKLKDTLAQHTELKSKLEVIEGEWMEASEAYESKL